MELTLGLAIGLAAGFATCWYFVGRRRGAELTDVRMRLAAAEADHAARREELEKARGDLDTHFKGIAAEIVRANGEELRQQAQERFRHQQEAVQTLVKPVGESLEKLQKRIGEIEEKRSGAYEGISKLIAETRTQMGDLRTETGRLNTALRSPQVRGRWGEQLLENIFELAGMRENVHYRQQVTLETDDGQSRPDFIVTIPGGMKIVIDSKTPLESYYRAHETEDEGERAELLRRHAQSLANHARDLGRKDYGQAVEGALDMVVLFVPADAILDAAMRAHVRLGGRVARPPRPHRHAQRRHRAAVHGPRRLAARDRAAERRGDRPRGARTLPPPRHLQRPHRRAARGASASGEGLQRQRRLLRAPPARSGAEAGEPARRAGIGPIRGARTARRRPPPPRVAGRARGVSGGRQPPMCDISTRARPLVASVRSSE